MYCMFHIKANMLGKCLRSEKGTFCRKALSKLGNMTKDSYHSADKTYNIINSFFISWTFYANSSRSTLVYAIQRGCSIVMAIEVSYKPSQAQIVVIKLLPISESLLCKLPDQCGDNIIWQ